MYKAKKVLWLVVGIFLAAGFSTPAQADIKQIKAYKEAYPDAKPKCILCHASEKPKKADGQHDLNKYGKKVMAIKQAPDANDYKQAGPGGESAS
jgi:hypothetical protein